ncbi:cytochrome P450 [Emericellopsis atlantica]|uniref:Cytochrome P450 n=1 Tax=Emericellopsis atlantica TaxID=2614577 RepID=A0A9P7ZUI7_9HYPO|nr:cytochrome P450 [Emericellopsis atlantica]KAG9258051.1 cytochrome P450 [Emericellopsis atlantica]
MPSLKTCVPCPGTYLLLNHNSVFSNSYRHSHSVPSAPSPQLNGKTSGRISATLRTEQKRHGRVMRLGPDAVCIYEAEALWHMNAARSTYTRGPWYSALRFDPRGDSVFSECDTAKHDRRRAKLAVGYAGKGLLDLENKIDAGLADLVQHLRARVVRGEATMNIGGRLLQFFQVDLISTCGFGKAWGDLADETDHFNYLKEGDASLAFLHTVSLSPVTRIIFSSPFFLKLFGPKRTDNDGFGKSLGFIEAVASERFREKEESKGQADDILGSWIKQGLSSEECQLDLAAQMAAGTETSITIVRGILLLLVTSPTIYMKAKQEIATAVRDGHVSSPVTNAEATKLPYMQALLWEGTRMMPPLTLGFPKRVPAGGDTVCDTFLPAGTDVYQNFGAMLRNPDVFGDDVDVFRPERFLALGDPDAVARMRKTVDLCFGHGRFSCLGKTLAQMELNKIFVQLLRNFDFQLADPEKPWTKASYSTFMINDFYMRVMEARLE